MSRPLGYHYYREHNKEAVLEVLKEYGPMPQQEICRIVGAKKGSLSSLLAILRKEGKVERCPLNGEAYWGIPDDPRLPQDTRPMLNKVVTHLRINDWSTLADLIHSQEFRRDDRSEILRILVDLVDLGIAAVKWETVGTGVRVGRYSLLDLPPGHKG